MKWDADGAVDTDGFFEFVRSDQLEGKDGHEVELCLYGVQGEPAIRCMLLPGSDAIQHRALRCLEDFTGTLKGGSGLTHTIVKGEVVFLRPGWTQQIRFGKPKSTGMNCSGKRCVEPFQPWAEPNRPDGTFLCYSCRSRGY